jgi:hypothetical protein
MGNVVAGWYQDPTDAGQQRYWDGARWTEATRPASPPTPRARRTSVYAGVAVLVILLGGGIFAFQLLLARGAPSPLAAAEAAAAAVATQQWGDLARVLAPDEIEWARGLVDALPSVELDDGESQDLSVELDFGAPIELADGVTALPVTTVTWDLRGGALTELLTDEWGFFGVRPSGSMSVPASARAVVVTVQRGSKWYVSPVGSILENVAHHGGLPGAGPAASRRGGNDPEAAVRGVIDAIAAEQPVAVLDHLDPSELRILDHYRPLLQAQSGYGTDTAIDVSSRVEGSTVIVQRIGYQDQWGSASVDLEQLCADEFGDRTCLWELRSEAQADPLYREALDRLLDSPTPQLRVVTVQDGPAHYVSLRGTLDQTLGTLLDRFDEHTLSGLLDAPDLSPHTVTVPAEPGATVTVPLDTGWNFVRYDGWSDGYLELCGAQHGTWLEDLEVAGRPVRSAYGSGFFGGSMFGATPHQRLYLHGAPAGVTGSVDVRVVQGGDGC